ncbi:MAG: Co2+/Mg2+ efflux protein ApaG [Burkholderiaceae bacterium]
MTEAAGKYHFEIRVKTEYLRDQSSPDDDQFAFAYTVSILNEGVVAAQLISRHWIIEDVAGQLAEVKGLGVVGHQPLIKPGEQFEYTSGSQLRSANGSMHGSYFFVAEDGHRFDVDIPMFALSVPRSLH